jgi:hypothetical protein
VGDDGGDGGGGAGDGGRGSLLRELALLTGAFVFVVWIENGEGRVVRRLYTPGPLVLVGNAIRE